MHWKDEIVHTVCFPTDVIFVGQNTKHLPYRKDAIEVSGFSSFSMVDYDSFSVVFLMCNLYLAVLF